VAPAEEGTVGLQLDLRAEKPGELTVVVEQRGDHHAIAKGPSVAPVIDDIGENRTPAANGRADPAAHPRIRQRAGQETAIAADDVLFAVGSELAKGGVDR